MTDDRVALIELIEKGADTDLVRDLLAFAGDRREARAAETSARSRGQKGGGRS